MYFINVPEHLVIVLKRFTNDGRKNTTNIEYPINLDLNKYILGYNKNAKYNLYGIVCHMGSINGGHYIAIAKNNSNQWKIYNDNNITNCNDNNIINNKAYILFYKKI